MSKTALALVLSIYGCCPSMGLAVAVDVAATSDQQTWWSFQPLADPAPPDVEAGRGRILDVDRFILARLGAEGLSPAPPAEKATLLRRVKFGLTGLPPTPQEIDSFLGDESPKAFQRVVNRLLASPQFGEHWGRYWLDVVRYADYLSPQADDVQGPGAENFDIEFYDAYRYRDWVVDALNRDMPFNEFVRHQISGDMLTGETGGELYADGLIATTVLAIGVWDNGDADKKKIVSDIVDDQINLVGRAFLSLTLACARCHDHKFDPISQEDYYSLAGIFYSTRILKNTGPVGLHTNALRVPLATADYLNRRSAQTARIDEISKTLAGDDRGTTAGASQQTPNESVPNESVNSDEEKASLEKELENLRQQLLPAPPTAMAALDEVTPGGLFAEIGDVPIHHFGRYDNLGPKVPRRMPVFFCGTQQAPITSGSGRWQLAQWIASAENPLTARVIVNRVWQQLLGQGLVRTPDNFGLSGEVPTHPELLDWLARDLIDSGWSIKQLIRTIVQSAAYQQASHEPPPTDPENRWLASFSPRRLRAEEIRDGMLAVARRLDSKMGGPATADLQRPCRSLYIQTVRADRRNYSTLLDAADPDQCVGKRHVSTTAPQALFFLNDAFVNQQSAHLAARLASEAPDDDRRRIERAYVLLYGRQASQEEISIGLEFLTRASQRNAAAAWSDYAHLLFCANEFCYVE